MGLYRDRVLPHLVDRVMNTRQHRLIRARVCAGLTGEVVEIGFGSGHNLPFLPVEVRRVAAVEPAGVAVRLARRRIAASTAEVAVVGLDGQRIELPDRSVDGALCTWTLCSVPDPVVAVREIARVLRPGGVLHFVEHGLAPDAGVQRAQRRLNPVQRRLAGGCHLDRRIQDILAAGGLVVSTLDCYYAPGQPRPFGATYEGRATPA